MADMILIFNEEVFMLFKIAACLIMSSVLCTIMYLIARKKVLSSYSNHELYRVSRIVHILKEINTLQMFYRKTIDDKELMGMILDYSMQTNNYKSALRNLNRI